MRQNITCPICQEVVAEWIEKQQQFKVSYSEKEKKNMKCHSFLLPARTVCIACKQFVIIPMPLTETMYCKCRVNTDEFIAKPETEKKPRGRWVLIRLLSVLRSVDCTDTKVRCHKCANEVHLHQFFTTGKSLGTPAEQEQAVDNYFEGNSHYQ